MSKIIDEMPSIKKLQEDITAMKLLSFLGGREIKQNKECISFKILEVEDRAIALKEC